MEPNPTICKFVSLLKSISHYDLLAKSHIRMVNTSSQTNFPTIMLNVGEHLAVHQLTLSPRYGYLSSVTTAFQGPHCWSTKTLRLPWYFRANYMLHM